jgi:hypothetical protein
MKRRSVLICKLRGKSMKETISNESLADAITLVLYILDIDIESNMEADKEYLLKQYFRK